jgi:hypothetical protein
MLLIPFLTITACAAVPPPSISKIGDTLFSDEFHEKTLDTNRWAAVKGSWTVTDGAVRGIELASDHHPAVLRAAVPFENAVIRFRFKLNGSDFVSLSVNQETGHHSRVLITPEGFALQKDRDKKDPRSLRLPLGRCNVSLKPGVWYAMTVEYCGDTMLARLDDKNFVVGTQEQIHTPKSNIALVVHGSSALFDDISVYTAIPDAGKNALIEQLRTQQSTRHDTASDPRTAYTEAETLFRNRLMKTDPQFNALINDRIAIEQGLQKRWPKAFRPGQTGLDARRKLLAEDPDFKALNSRLAKARRAELDYLQKQSPELAD